MGDIADMYREAEAEAEGEEDARQMEKLDRASDVYAILIEFVDWIDTHPTLSLGEWCPSEFSEHLPARLFPLLRSTQSVIYEYLGIDAEALEAERRALLDSLRQGESS